MTKDSNNKNIAIEATHTAYRDTCLDCGSRDIFVSGLMQVSFAPLHANEIAIDHDSLSIPDCSHLAPPTVFCSACEQQQELSSYILTTNPK